MQRLIALIAIFTFTSGSAAAHPRLDIHVDKTLDIPTTLTVLIASPDRGFRGTFAWTKHRTKLPPDYAEWSKVATCEEGGWKAAVSWVPHRSTDIGGYTIAGISGRNWISYSRRLGLSTRLPAPGATTIAERVQAIRIGDAIEHGYIPDQGGCSPW